MGILVWILAFVPGIIWLVYVYKKDKLEPEPIGWVILVFICGALLVPLCVLIEKPLSSGLGVDTIRTTADAAKVSWFVAGLVEEGAKFLLVIGLVSYRRTFNEPMDGIVYAAAAALGFASAENIIYIKKFGAFVILLRGPLSTLGHMLFSSIWGYAIGKAKFGRENRLSLLAKGFILSAFFHGLYDFLLFTKVLAALAVYLVLTTLRKMLLRMVAEAQAKSPFAESG